MNHDDIGKLIKKLEMKKHLKVTTPKERKILNKTLGRLWALFSKREMRRI